MRLRTFLGTLFETEAPKPWKAPAPDPTSATSRDLDLIAAVIEWRDARQPILDGPHGESTTAEGRAVRQAMWGRYSKAESRLMELARRLPSAETRRTVRLPGGRTRVLA